MNGLVVTQDLRRPRCPFCRRVLEVEGLVAGEQTCRSCGGVFEATAFAPRAAEPDAPPPAVGALPGFGTPCAYHPENAAESHCNRCGVVMCRLCRIDAGDRQLCAPCFDRLAESKELRIHQTRAADFRGLAWLSVILGVYPLFGPILGPAAIVFGILALRQRRREVGDGPGLASSSLAIGCGVLVMVPGLFLLFAILLRALGGSR